MRVALELLQCQGLCFLPYLAAARTVSTAGYEPAKATDHKELDLLCHIAQLECLFSVVNDPYHQQNTVLGQFLSSASFFYRVMIRTVLFIVLVCFIHFTARLGVCLR